MSAAASPSPEPSPAGSSLRSFRFSLWDLPVLLLAAAAGGAFFALPRLYHTPPQPFFPRQPAEFLAPADLERVKSSARAVLDKTPDDVSALADLAVVAFQEGPDHALECIEAGQRALDLGAFDARLFYYTAVSYETKGLNDYASGAFEKYLRHRPDDFETRLRLGNLYYRMGDLEKAQAAFRAVLDARPGDPLVSFNLAVVLRDRQQWEDGLAVLKPVLDRDKTLPAGGFRVLGDLYRGVKDTTQALAFYQKELARSPDDAEALSAQAQAFDDAGQTDDALASWKRVLDLNPKNKQAYTRVRALTQKQRQAQKKKR